MSTNRQLALYNQLLVEMGREPSEGNLSEFSVLGIAEASDILSGLINERKEQREPDQGAKLPDGDQP